MEVTAAIVHFISFEGEQFIRFGPNNYMRLYTYEELYDEVELLERLFQEKVGIV